MHTIQLLLLSTALAAVAHAQVVPPGYTDQTIGVVPSIFDGGTDELAAALAVAEDGTVYVSEALASGDIFRCPPGGAFTFYTRLPGQSAYGLALVGDILYAGGSGGGLFSIPTRDQIAVATRRLELADPLLSIVDGGNGHLLVGTSKSLHDVDLANNLVRVIYPAADVAGIAADPASGSYRFIEATLQQVSRLDPPTSVTPFYAPTPLAPDGLAVQSLTSEVYVACASEDSIRVIDAAGAGIASFASGIRFDDAGNAPSALAFSPNGDRLFYGTVNAASQFEVRAIDGFPAQIASDLTAPAGVLSGHVTLLVDADDAQADPLQVTFEYSTNGGARFEPCTAAPGSVLTNPTAFLPSPIAGAAFTWNTIADRLGMGGPQSVLARIAVTDGGLTVYSLIGVDVDNAWPTMSCQASPAGQQTYGDIDVVLDMTGPPGSVVSMLASYSVDGGTTWQLARPGPGSMVSNPGTGLGLGSIVFAWDTITDGVGVSTPAPDVAIRFDLLDSFGAPAACTTASFAVDNQICSGLCGDCDLNGQVDIVDALRMAQFAAGLLTLPSPASPSTYTCNVVGDVHPSPTAVIDAIDALVCARFTLGLDQLACCVP